MKIVTSASTKQKLNIITVCAAIALFISIIGALFSMLKIPFPPAINIISPIESLKILGNHLFTISEQYQAYLYRHFSVTVPPQYYEKYIFTALIAVILLTAVIIISAQKFKFIYVFIFFAVTALQIYFGVFAATVWNIALYAVIGWAILRNANLAFFSVAAITAAAIAMFIFPGTNPFLAELSESMRDYFGEQYQRVVTAAITPQEITAQNTSSTLQVYESTAGTGNLDGGQQFRRDIYERFAGSQIGVAFGQRLWILWLIGLAFAVGFALWFLKKVITAYRRRTVFDSPDCRLAVDAMFKYMVSCLSEIGAPPQNLAYVRYVDRPLFSGEYSENYLSIVGLWQKATYSDHTITESDRQQMRGFLEDTLCLILKRKAPITRTVTRARLFLGKGDAK